MQKVWTPVLQTLPHMTSLPFICFFTTFLLQHFFFCFPFFLKLPRMIHGIKTRKFIVITQRQCYLSFEIKVEIDYLLEIDYLMYLITYKTSLLQNLYITNKPQYIPSSIGNPLYCVALLHFYLMSQCKIFLCTCLKIGYIFTILKLFGRNCHAPFNRNYIWSTTNCICW